MEPKATLPYSQQFDCEHKMLNPNFYGTQSYVALFTTVRHVPILNPLKFNTTILISLRLISLFFSLLSIDLPTKLCLANLQLKFCTYFPPFNACCIFQLSQSPELEFLHTSNLTFRRPFIVTYSYNILPTMLADSQHN